MRFLELLFVGGAFGHRIRIIMHDIWTPVDRPERAEPEAVLDCSRGTSHRLNDCCHFLHCLSLVGGSIDFFSVPPYLKWLVDAIFSLFFNYQPVAVQAGQGG